MIYFSYGRITFSCIIFCSYIAREKITNCHLDCRKDVLLKKNATFTDEHTFFVLELTYQSD